jgi:PAS domain S-box-containing protein
MGRAVSTRATIGFAVAWAVLLASAAVTYRNLSVLAENEERLTHTLKVRLAIGAVEVQLGTVATEHRSYLLTGDPDRLKAYRAAARAVPERLRRVAELTADNARQQERLADLQPLVRAWLKALEAGSAARQREGLDAARRFELAERDRARREDLRRALSAVDAEEERLLQVRAARSRSSYVTALTTGLLTTFLGLGLVVLLYVLVARDLEARRRSAGALEQEREHFRQLADAMPQIVWVAHPDGYHDYFNQRWYDYTGVSPEVSIGFGWSGLLHPEDRERARTHWDLACRSGEPFEIEYRLRGRAGSYRWFLGRALPVRDSGSRVTRWFGTCTDIDDKKQAEVDLRRERERYRSLVLASAQVVWTTDAQGAVVEDSPSWRAFTGQSFEQWRGRGWLEAIHPDDRPGVAEAFDRAIATQEVYEGEYRLRSRDGGYRWTEVRGVPVRGPDGVVREWVGMNTDVTDLREAQERLRRANEELELRVQERTGELSAANEALWRSNRELEQFASVASHDLQEPLRKIQAFGDRLQSRCGAGLGQQGREYLERMLSAAARMRRLIDDLLTYARVTTRAQPFVPVDLAVVAREVVGDLEGRLQQTGGRVEVGELPVVSADPLQMRQLLQNLIGNGLKFHRPGAPPLVRLYQEPGGGEQEGNGESAGLPASCVTVAVQDNGIGFEEVYLDRIFEVFQRLHGRGEYEGTGMGLAICRKIVERHAGRIWARTAPGAGATFLVTLPAHPSAHPEAPVRDASQPEVPGRERA